jgi:hypothetical protein
VQSKSNVLRVGAGPPLQTDFFFWLRLALGGKRGQSLP